MFASKTKLHIKQWESMKNWQRPFYHDADYLFMYVN